MATLKINVDDTLKEDADTLFSSLGMDTSTAIRIFLSISVENAGIPFAVQHKTLPDSLWQAIDDSRHQRNLYGPFENAKDAVDSMLED